MSKKDIPQDVLASRYASDAMVAIWSEWGKTRLERKLWLSVLRAQKDHGLDVPQEAIAAYERVVDDINLESIREREAVLRHDVMARIREFNELAGYQLVHQGLTSRDLTDNVEQLQIRLALKHVHGRTVALLDRFARKAAEFKLLDTCGRSHLVPGQTTTMGKRFAGFAEELFGAFIRLEYLLHIYPLRGIKGAMGTQQDMVDLVSDPTALDARIRKELGFIHSLACTGQVYPRSLDFLVVGMLVQLASPAGNFATMVRLLAGLGLASESSGKKQKGSSAMPHKINSRTSERICGLLDVLTGFHSMLEKLVGSQWLEGDVSCSVVRRVALPGAFFAFDGIYESAMTVLDEMEVLPSKVRQELNHYLPFLSTTSVLMAAVKKGAGRENAHDAIREHVLTVIGRIDETDAVADLAALLADDARVGLAYEELMVLMSTPNHGRAAEQVEAVCVQVSLATRQYPDLVKYMPGKIL